MTSALFAAALLMGAAATAQAPAQTEAVRVAAVDRDFAVKTAQGGRLEVQLATLAEKKATTPKARTLAAQIHTDHDRANTELEAIARRKGIPLDSAEPTEATELKSKLTALDGPAFDQAYVAAMIEDHRTDIAAFERYATDGKDDDLKAFAAKTLPALRKHLSLAEAADSEVTP